MVVKAGFRKSYTAYLREIVDLQRAQKESKEKEKQKSVKRRARLAREVLPGMDQI
jgi:hypothetical protein